MIALTMGFTGLLAEYVPVPTIFGIFATLCGVVEWVFSDLKDH